MSVEDVSDEAGVGMAGNAVVEVAMEDDAVAETVDAFLAIINNEKNQ